MQMSSAGEYTWKEIYTQPDAWRQAIEILHQHRDIIQQFVRNGNPSQVILTGCGSTYHLAKAAAVMMQEVCGLAACALPASELWLSPRSSHPPSEGGLLLAISRSGETSETIHACNVFHDHQRGQIMTIVCDPASTLSTLGNFNLIFPSGLERSIAQTRAFTTLYLGLLGMCLIWSGNEEKFSQLMHLPPACQRIIAEYHNRAALLGKNMDLDRIYFLGSGGRFGLACELSLKMKEMSLSHSEAFHFLEFRHGPKAMVNGKTLVVGLVSETNVSNEEAVLAEVRKLGAQTVSMGENNTDVSFASGIEEVLRNILYLPFGQMMAYERSIVKGLDPDHPTNLDAVVKLH
jgi:glucosamine--fructose-6-phosphate aminotransferase (isomerizing)